MTDSDLSPSEPDTCPASSEVSPTESIQAGPETPEPDPETPEPIRETAVETPQETAVPWDAVEIVALLSVGAVSVAAFSWSAIALHGMAVMAGMSSNLAWGAPVIVDGPIVQSAFGLVALQRREKAGVTIPIGIRRFFWTELALAELVSLVGNAAHAAVSNERVLTGLAAGTVAGAAPVAALAVTHALTALLEVPRIPDPLTPAAGNEQQRTEIVAAQNVSVLSPGVSPGDAGVSPGVSGAAEGDSVETLAVSRTDQGDAAGDSQETAEPLDRDARILALHRDGRSYREIGHEVGVRHGTVGKILARLKAAQESGAPDDEPPDPAKGVVLKFVR